MLIIAHNESLNIFTYKRDQAWPLFEKTQTTYQPLLKVHTEHSQSWTKERVGRRKRRGHICPSPPSKLISAPWVLTPRTRCEQNFSFILLLDLRHWISEESTLKYKTKEDLGGCQCGLLGLCFLCTYEKRAWRGTAGLFKVNPQGFTCLGATWF